MPDKDSPIWPIIRVATRSLVLLLGLWLFYNKLDPRDIKTLLLCLAADAGLTGASMMKKD